MPRIRQIKPGFFKDADLYDAEVSSGLPLRLAFAGVWTVADRRGIFAWSRNIKPDVLPYDACDMLAVLEALAAAGFVQRYEVDGKSYGIIPGFAEHQHFHKDERASQMPAPPEHGADHSVDHRTSTVPTPGKHGAAIVQNGRVDGERGTGNGKRVKIPPVGGRPRPTGEPIFDLAPYLAAHDERFPGASVSAGRFGKALKPLEQMHGPAETLRRWKIFLPQKGELGPEYFARTWSEWSDEPVRATASDAPRVPRATEGRIYA